MTSLLQSYKIIIERINKMEEKDLLRTLNSLYQYLDGMSDYLDQAKSCLGDVIDTIEEFGVSEDE